MVIEVNLDLYSESQTDFPALLLFALCVCLSVVNCSRLCSGWTHEGGGTFVLGYHGSFEPQLASMYVRVNESVSCSGVRPAGSRSRKCCKI